MVCYTSKSLIASSTGAVLAGAIIFYLGMQRPLWRSAAVVLLAALAAYFAFSYVFPEPGPECAACVQEEPPKKQQKVN